MRQPLYDPVTLEGMTFVPRQGNNSYIFPGDGLGAIASGTRLVTDEMFMAAAHTLANLVSEEDLKQGSLYPALPRIREVSAHSPRRLLRSLTIAGLRLGRRRRTCSLMSSRKCMILTIEVSGMMPVDDRAKKPSAKNNSGEVPRARWHDRLSLGPL